LSSIQLKKAKNVSSVIEFITQLRSFKNSLGINPSSFCNIYLNDTSSKFKKIINDNLDIIKRLGRIEKINSTQNISQSFIKTILADENIKIQFDNNVDLQAQKILQEKKQQEILNKITICEKKLENQSFVKNAPKNIVDNEREMLSNYKIDLEKINIILRSFV
jgi:valyl-tRNA synthetase